MIKKLRLRLTLVCTVATVLVLAAMALVALSFSEKQLREQALQSFLSSANAVCYNLRGRTVVDHGWLSRMEEANGLYIRIETGSGPLLHVRHDESREELTAHALEEGGRQGLTGWGQLAVGSQTDRMQFTFEHGDTVYYAAICTVPMSANTSLEVTVLKSTQGEREQIVRLRLIFALCVGAASLCLLAFAWLFTRWACRPIEASHRRQNDFVAAASHEMRSPLAVIQASAGALQQAAPEQVRSLADLISGEGRRMNRVLKDLLFLAAADGNRLTADFEPVEPDTLLLGISERFEPMAREKGVRLVVELPEETPECVCDPSRLEQLLYILVDNALRYTPRGGTVALRTGLRGRSQWFSVSDTGPGIPDGEKERVFDRFYRGDCSRTEREHYGLGLSIAKEIAVLHRGTLTISDAPGGGAVVTFAMHRRGL